MKLACGQWLEKHCTVSIATAPLLYSLSTVIKILPMSAGLWVCLVGGTSFMFQHCCPFHSWKSQFLCLLKEWCWKKHNHSLACQSKRSQIQQWDLCAMAQILPFGTAFLEEEHKVEQIHAYYWFDAELFPTLELTFYSGSAGVGKCMWGRAQCSSKGSGQKLFVCGSGSDPGISHFLQCLPIENKVSD